MKFISLFSFRMVLLVLLGFSVAAHAQHDHLWYFGNRAGLDFVSGVPTALTDSQLNSMEGTSTVCDQTGQLLFYTNGIRVMNRNHQPMPNGGDLHGGSSSTQPAVSFPDPGNPNRYYLFTADQFAGPAGIKYSIVDQTADGGLGDVVIRNIPLMTPACEKLAAVSHANGNDVWVIGHQWDNNAFYAWRITASGVNAPVVSTVGSAITGMEMRSFGEMKVSPDGTRLAMANNDMNLQLFDFDAATGTVSNPITLSSNSNFGTQFSHTSNVLYGTEINRVYQYDLTATDIPGSRTLISDMGFPVGSMALGPDSKIYLTSYAATRLSVINKPEIVGTGCDLVPLTADLMGRRTFWGLPVIFQSALYITGVTAQDDCTGNPISFAMQTTIAPDSVHWDFGDGGFSDQPNPQHTYTIPGSYRVLAKARKGGYERYFLKEITVMETPVAVQPPDMMACDEAENGQQVFDLSSQDNAILGGLASTLFTVSYHLSLAEAQANSNALASNYTNATNPQAIYARLTSPQGCHSETFFNLHVVPKPQIDMPLDHWICSGATLTLTAPAGFSSYLWSTSETTRSIAITTAGVYTLTITESMGALNCEKTLTFVVRQSVAPVIKQLQVQDWSDAHNSIAILMQDEGNYEFSIDGIHYQDSAVFTGLFPGKYTVFVRDKNGCGQTSQEAVLLMYPKFFSPNGDGYNDRWAIEFGAFEPEIKVAVFDRYGKLLASFTGNSPGWDGQHNGRPLPSTDYWFVVTRRDGKQYKGHFSMVR
ncbi:T9SS type B sorting domain-containing protein [Flavobacterium sp.]|uniref:T9SS type B sorting domain-containing protein n=1 Tax=Flavobacterium sp. TaxID=239 RepID=UPI0039E64D0F